MINRCYKCVMMLRYIFFFAFGYLNRRNRSFRWGTMAENAIFFVVQRDELVVMHSGSANDCQHGDEEVVRATKRVSTFQLSERRRASGIGVLADWRLSLRWRPGRHASRKGVGFQFVCFELSVWNFNEFCCLVDSWLLFGWCLVSF